MYCLKVKNEINRINDNLDRKEHFQRNKAKYVHARNISNKILNNHFQVIPRTKTDINYGSNIPNGGNNYVSFNGKSNS